jgi:hypothetical protein
MARTLAELSRHEDELLSAHRMAEREFYESRKAADNLLKLDREHFELFGIDEPAPPAPMRLTAPIKMPVGKTTAQVEAEEQAARLDDLHGPRD